VVVTDPLPAATELFVNDIGGVNSGPCCSPTAFVPSGLSYSFAWTVQRLRTASRSRTTAAQRTTTSRPPIGNGCDARRHNIKINLSGTFNAASGGNDPSFSVFFRVRVK